MADANAVVRFPTGGQQPEQPPPEVHATKLLLDTIVNADNIAQYLTEESLNKIGNRCVDEYEADDDSRDEWKRCNETSIKLAKLVKEDKAWPWPGCANVKYPLLAEACITFAARAYPEIIRGNDVVLARVIGKDPNNEKADRAKRISDYMSYQCTEEMDFWESDTDKLLHLLPIIGTCFRKTYHDPIRAGNMQSGNISRLVSGMDLIVNHNLTNYEQVRRETEIVDLYENDVIERQRSGLWLDIELKQDTIDGKEDLPRGDKPLRFIEQHRWLDLDEDGYEEPYIATVHLASRKTMRIVARFDSDNVVLNQKGEVVHIEATQHYTKYGFIPNPDGGLYDLGFGALLTPLNEAINTVTNQLLDSGTLANLSGGFLAKGIRIKGGQMRLMAGEWKVLDTGGALLKDCILPLPNKEPSATLFSLLQFLIETGKSIASIKDVLQGNVPNADVPATTVLALIEQGQKVYNSIHKRVYRSLKQEFKKLFLLNGKYLPQQQYQMLEDDPRADVVNDFSSKDYDVCPVADPQVSSQAQRLAKAQALVQAMGTFQGIKQENVGEDYMIAIGVDDPTRYLPSKEELAQQAAEAKPKQDMIDHIMLEKAVVEIEKNQATAIKTIADAMVSITKAETDKINTQLAVFTEQMKALVMQTSPTPADPNAPQPQTSPMGPGGLGGNTNEGGMGPMAPPQINPMADQQIGGGNPPA